MLCALPKGPAAGQTITPTVWSLIPSPFGRRVRQFSSMPQLSASQQTPAEARRDNKAADVDLVLQDIANYVYGYKIESPLAVSEAF